MKKASPFMRKALAVATATVLSSVCLAQSQKSRMVTERMLGDATNSVIDVFVEAGKLRYLRKDTALYERVKIHRDGRAQRTPSVEI